MYNVFVIRVVLSFFIAGIWIALSTILAERFGSKIGGLIANLPSNILISLIFIYLVNDIGYLTDLVPGIPIGLIIDSFFLVIFIILLRYNLAISVVVSLVIWFVLAFLLAKVDLNNLTINIILFILVTLLTVWFVERVVKIPSKQNSRKKYSVGQIIFRTAFGGFIVATIVVISKYSNPFFTGIFSTFPAMLLSTLIILSINQGREFAMATGKVLVLSLTNIIVYALLVKLTYPTIGVTLGTIISYLGSGIWILLLHPLVKRMN